MYALLKIKLEDLAQMCQLWAKSRFGNNSNVIYALLGSDTIASQHGQTLTKNTILKPADKYIHNRNSQRVKF